MRWDHLSCAAILALVTQPALSQYALQQPATTQPLVIVGADLDFADGDIHVAEPDHSLSRTIVRRHINWANGSGVPRTMLTQSTQSFPTDYFDGDQTILLESGHVESPRQDLLLEQTPVAAEPATDGRDPCAKNLAAVIVMLADDTACDPDNDTRCDCTDPCHGPGGGTRLGCTR